MEYSEYVKANARNLAELGDATADLQAIVDAGLAIPSGFYYCKGKVRLHGALPKRPDASGAGYATFVHVEPVQVKCTRCGAVSDWLTPIGSVLTGIPLSCGECGMSAPRPAHDVVSESYPRYRTVEETWEAGRVLVGGYAPGSPEDTEAA